MSKMGHFLKKINCFLSVSNFLFSEESYFLDLMQVKFYIYLSFLSFYDRKLIMTLLRYYQQKTGTSLFSMKLKKRKYNNTKQTDD